MKLLIHWCKNKKRKEIVQNPSFTLQRVFPRNTRSGFARTGLESFGLVAFWFPSLFTYFHLKSYLPSRNTEYGLNQSNHSLFQWLAAPNIPSVSIFVGRDAPSRLYVMHVVAQMMFSSKEVKNTALSLWHTAKGHFHVTALAKLTNASTPDNPSRDGGKTVGWRAALPVRWN